ncbi:MAG: ATP-binding protein [Chloroflexota bacterium]|nr:ATP-binding protein [Chloroflexota bacterium]
MAEEMERLGDVLARFAPARSSGAPDDSPEEEAPACPLCNGTRWVRVDVPFGHPRWGSIDPCSCWEQEGALERRERLLRYSNLGVLARFTFDTLNEDGNSSDPDDRRLFHAALEAARDFAESPSGWLVLAGPSGCGKTHLAAAVTHRTVEAGVPALFMVAPDLLDHLRAAYAPNSDADYDLLFDQVRNAPVLVLDGLGAQASTPWAQEKLFQVLNHRYNLELPTVVTLAAPLETLEERFQTRLSGAGTGHVYELALPRSATGRSLGSLPEQMQTMTFEAFSTEGNRANARQRESLQAALAAAQSVAGDPAGVWLVLIGSTGVGKTHLAASIWNERMRQGAPAFFAFVPELLDHLRYTFAPNSATTYDELFERVKGAELLALDDLGSQATTPWAQEKLYQLLVHRHNARLPTVITMQGDTVLQPSIASRLKDDRFVTALEMEAPDFRDGSPPAAPRRR